MKEAFAVFEIKGDECEQITVWLDIHKAKKYLEDRTRGAGVDRATRGRK